MKRTWCVALVAVGFGGCMDYEKFDKRFEKKYCDEYELCAPDLTCPFEEENDPSNDFSVTCDDESTFDRKAAKQCLDAAWECDDSIPTVPAIRPAAVCDEVCDAAVDEAAA